MIAKTVTCAITIEGIALPGTGNSATRFHKRYAPRIRTFLGVLPGECLVTLPRSVQTSVEPISSRYEVSSFAFELSLTDQIAALMFRQGWIEVASLSEGISASSTTVAMSRQIDGAVVDVTHVFVDDETIALGTWDAALGAYVGCVRGVALSEARAHSAGANVYDLPPYWRGREVTLYTLDADDQTLADPAPWRARWRGSLDDMRTIDDGTKIQLDCSELLSGLLNSTVYDAPVDVRGLLPAAFFDAESRAHLEGTITATPQSYEIQTRKFDRWGSAGGVVFRIGNSAICAQRVGVSYVFGPFGLLRSDSGEVTEGPAHELLTVSKQFDETFGGVSYTTGLTYPYHPLTAAIALLTSTASSAELIDTLVPDVVGAPFALDLSRYIDTLAWREMIDATPEVEIDQLYIGWDAGERILETIIEKLLRPYGYYLAITDDGRIGVARLRTLDVREYCEGQSRGIELLSPLRGGTLTLSANMASAINQVVATIGETPWSEPYPVTVRINGNSSRAARLSDGVTWSFDLSTIRRERALSYGTDAGQTATNALISTAVLGSLGLPRLDIAVPDGRLRGIAYDLGSLVFITGGAPKDPWFIGPDGVRYTLPSADEGVTVTFAGTIIGRAFNLETHTYDLTLLLLSYRTQALARLRAPSMRIVEWNGDVTFTGPATPDFDAPTAAPDAQMFREGDQVQIVDSDGVLWQAGFGRIAATLGAAIEFQTYPWSGDPVSTTAPRYLRLAQSSDYTNDTLLSCFDRPWTYLGDAIGRIMDTSDVLVPGDRYG